MLPQACSLHALLQACGQIITALQATIRLCTSRQTLSSLQHLSQWGTDGAGQQEEWRAFTWASTETPEPEDNALKSQIGRLKEQISVQDQVMLDQQDDISSLRSEKSNLLLRIKELEGQLQSLKPGERTAVNESVRMASMPGTAA
jgi:chromosome segregation ATPase